MYYSVAFRYNKAEYQTVYETNCTFGGTGAGAVAIPGLTGAVLTIRNNGAKALVTTSAPLPSRTQEVDFNSVIYLTADRETSVYISRFSGVASQRVKLPYNGSVMVGRSSDCDIVVSYPIISRRHFRLLCVNGEVHVEDLNSTFLLYLNGKPVQKAVLKSDSVLSVYTFLFEYRQGVLCFRNMGEKLTCAPALQYSGGTDAAVPASQPKAKQTAAPNRKYLEYHLSPRIREQLPTEGLILSSAPGAATAPGGRQGNAAYMISTGAMLAASLASGLVSPAALLMRAVGFISPIANMAMMGKMSKEEKQQYEEYEKMRHERYQAYIAQQKARIRQIADVQRRIVAGENRSPADCLKTVEKLTRNLWERSPEDSDFLVTRVGIGSVPLCVEVKTRADVDGFRLIEEDELEKLSAQIIEETRLVDQMPVCVDLRKYPLVGLIGPRESTHYLLRNLLVELTVQHNFIDLRLVVLLDENAKNSFQMLRWLPHVWDGSQQSRYLAFDRQRRHTVCEMLGELIRSRREEASQERQQKTAPLPHYLVIVQNRALIQEEEIFQELIAADEALGITTLMLGENLYDLPQKTRLLIECNGSRCCVYEKDHYDQRLDCIMDDAIHGAEMDAFCRRMAAVELSAGQFRAPIPTSVTFLQGYGVKTVEELDAWTRWSSSRPYLSLAAPIGVTEGGRLFSLDVRSGDTAHGPHGLLAGTTGSGKSELLQTWILSMALNYHPHDVNFVIIDYKGGGMSDLMEPLPHVVGKITNIDRNISRSLIALKSELRRRQELFAKVGVNNIDKYQRAYEDRLTRERLPHLIIVTDEFAEMKKEEPEFMTELNSVATIGRSLGIHMLLATQKPAGVVTDQINSNSRFRICMKVQDVADSREMLKRADAARITQSGRAYIRVGEDELFQEFQSFYSGAEYQSGMEAAHSHENRVKLVTVTGNRIAYAKKDRKKKSDSIDQLAAVTQYINKVCIEHGIQRMKGPWLPELKRWLTLEDLGVLMNFNGKCWTERLPGLAVPVGQYDIPQQQKQGIQYLDFMEYGHFGVFGAPGSGKTTLLKTVVTNLGRYYQPDQVEITILDAANWSMTEFRQMPHVKEVITNQEEQALQKFIKRMEKELSLRRALFLKAAVASLEAYWETVGQDLPAMVIVIDHIEPLFEQYFEVGDLLTELAAAGAAFGIYLLFTANSTMGIKFKFLQLIKGTIALQMTDAGEYSALVGPVHGISLPHFPGRALFRGNPPVAFQTAMYLDEKGDKERSKALEKLLHAMKHSWQSSSSKQSSPVMTSAPAPKPEKKPEPLGRGMILLGKNTQTYDPVVLDLREKNVLAVAGAAAEKRAAWMQRLREQLSLQPEHQIIVVTAENSGEVRQMLAETLNSRKKSLKQHKKEDSFDQNAWMAGFTQICLLMEDTDQLCQSMEESDLKFYRKTLTQTGGMGVTVVASAPEDIFADTTPNLLLDALRECGQILALDGRPAAYAIHHDLEDPEAETVLDEDEAALICGSTLQLLKQ